MYSKEMKWIKKKSIVASLVKYPSNEASVAIVAILAVVIESICVMNRMALIWMIVESVARHSMV